MIRGKAERFRTVDGYTESAWKSLAIKAARMGWPEGLKQAGFRLSNSTMKYVLLTSVFEDTFPVDDELSNVLGEIRRLEWHGLCVRETHHGRGYTEAFCDLADEACAADPVSLYPEARKRSLYMPARAWNVFYTWVKLAPNDPHVLRVIDRTPWRGMPKAILDGHTIEGRQRGTIETVLSGSYEQHRVIGQRVMKDGWDPIREEVHGDIDRPPKVKVQTAIEKAISRNLRRKHRREPDEQLAFPDECAFAQLSPTSWLCVTHDVTVAEISDEPVWCLLGEQDADEAA